MKTFLDIQHDKEYFKLFKTKIDLINYLNEFSKKIDQNFWWTFQYQPEDLRMKNQLLLLTNEFDEIIRYIKEKNIPHTFAKEDTYSFYLNSFETKERALKILKRWNEYDDN